ncbi:MAG: alanine racemase [Thermoanaerobaculia bacterium]
MAHGIDERRLRAAAAHGARGRETPFYLFDREAARSRLRRLREAAGPEAVLFYPWKCNRHPALLDLADAEGCGAEVTAAEDLAAALRRSDASRVLYQGPAKTERSLDRALAAGAWLVADSEEDAQAILARARAVGAAPRYLLRFRPRAAEASQRTFGLAPSRATGLCARLAREGRPLPTGLAFHLGTGLLSARPFVSAVREAARLAGRLRRLGIPVEILNVGGGFPARGEVRRDTHPRTPPGTAESFLAAILAAMRRAQELRDARLFFEPGRAVAADAFHLVTRVVRVTPGRVYVDASRMSHAFFVAWGRHAWLPIPRRPGDGAVEIAGPLPVDIDRLAAREKIGRPREGDLLAIGSVGAYNLIVANDWAGRAPQIVEVGVSASWGGRRSGGQTRRSRRSPRPKRPSA